MVRPEPGPTTVRFHDCGPLTKVDERGEVTGYVDVFERIEVCRAHYEEVGLGAD